MVKKVVNREDEKYKRDKEIADENYKKYRELDERTDMLERELYLLRIQRENAYKIWVHSTRGLEDGENAYKMEMEFISSPNLFPLNNLISKTDMERYLEIRRKKILEGMPYPLASEYAYKVLYGEEEDEE